MKKFTLYCAVLCFLSVSIFSQNHSGYFKFIDPVPGAKYINPQTGIILKPERSLNASSLYNKSAIEITGSVSGNCSFEIIQSSGGETFILKPVKPFAPGETVKIDYSDIIKTNNGKSIRPFSYTFTVKSKEVKVNRQNNLSSELFSSGKPPFIQNSGNTPVFPSPALIHSDNPSPGRILITTFGFNPSAGYYIIILNNDGTVFYSQEMSDVTVDFNMQYNGNLTYFRSDRGLYEEIDDYFSVVDEFYCGNGYGTDLHELKVLEDRSAWLMSYDSQHVDMSQIVPGGNPNAVVSGLIIQKIDKNKNVIFQWRSWDHFQIIDAWHQNMLAPSIDAVHGNAIEVDYDGHIMISSRHLDEITKINTTTGAIIWRLGGKNNQFTFINDPDKFNYQHAIRRLKNGNIILYDNGNFHTPRYSRSVEYRLNEVNKTAERVWQYRSTPDIFGPAMGNSHRLPNGNTITGWGLTPSSTTALTETREDGTKALEITLPAGVFSYRAFKYDYKMNEVVPVTAPNAVFLGQNFPNPFNPVTKIKFGMPRVNSSKEPVRVRLAVYDVLGREVAVLLDKDLKPYTYEVDFDGAGLTTGIYFYTLNISGGDARYYESKKMILLK